MSYCAEADLAKFESTVSTWGKNIADKILEADRAIEKFLRNTRELDSEDIAALSTLTLADLKTAACYYVLFLCHNDMSEANNDAYALKAKDYKSWYEAELNSINVVLTGSEGDDEPPSSYGGGRLTL